MENLKNMIVKSEVRVVTESLMDLYMWICSQLDVPQEDSVVSLAIAMNEMLLSKFFSDTDAKLWKKESDPQWESWRRAELGLIDKWADRDNTGRVKSKPDGSPSIDENAVEYSKEREALVNGEFKEFCDRLEENTKKNQEILSAPVRVQICCIESWDHCPKTIPPRLLAILMGDTVSAIMTSTPANRR